MGIDAHKVIHLAIEKEKSAYEFYARMSKSTNNSDVKRLFTKLAVEETRHERILELFDVYRDFELAKEKVEEENVLHFVMDEPPEQFLTIQDLKKAFKIALDRERQAYDMYALLYDEAEDPKVKELFNMFMQMEKGHKILLKTEYEKIFKLKL